MHILVLALIGLTILLCACGGGDPAAPAGRSIQINGRPLPAAGFVTLERLETAAGSRLADGAYWYDPLCGAFGVWGGPMVAALPAGLDLGGPVPADASGGGTGVFINGRELHAFDVLHLQHLLGPVQPGRYFTDAFGNAGLEGGPVLVNLIAAAHQRGGSSYYSVNPHANTRSSISSEGASFTDSTGKTVSWYPGLGSSVSR